MFPKFAVYFVDLPIVIFYRNGFVKIQKAMTSKIECRQPKVDHNSFLCSFAFAGCCGGISSLLQRIHFSSQATIRPRNESFSLGKRGAEDSSKQRIFYCHITRTAPIWSAFLISQFLVVGGNATPNSLTPKRLFVDLLWFSVGYWQYLVAGHCTCRLLSLVLRLRQNLIEFTEK